MKLPNALSTGGRMKFLAKDAAIYGLGGALNKALALLTFPLLARHFSVEDFGVIDLLNSTLVLAVTILVFGQDSAVARYYYEDDDKGYRQQVISQSLFLQIGVLAIALPLLWINAGYLASALMARDDGELIIKIMILQAPFFVLVNFSQNLLKWTFKRNQFLLISVGSTVLAALGIVIGVALGMELVHLFAIYLTTRLVAGLLGLWFVREWIAIPRGWTQLRQILPFAIPYGVISVLNMLLPVFERTQVQALVGTTELGLFAAGAKLAMLILLPVNAFDISWSPFSLSIYKEPDAAVTYRMVLTSFSAMVLAAVFCLTAIATPLIVLLGSDRYEGAAVVVFALCAAPAIGAIGSITSLGIVLSKKSHLKLYGYLSMAATAAVAIPVLGTLFGLVGVAWGSLLAHIVKVIVEALLAQRVHPIAWSFSPPLLLGGFALGLGFLHQMTFDPAAFWGLSPVAGLSAIVMLVMGLFLLDQPARDRLKSLMRKLRPA